MAIDKVTSASITDSAVTSAKVASGVLQPNFRNIIINGDMNQAQRSTSVSSITSSGYHSLDRFRHGINSQGTWTISQASTVPTGQGFNKSLKMNCTTADSSPASGDYLWIEQRVEGQNLQYLKKGTSSAESLTVSFWVYATKTGTNIVELYDKDNTRHICQSYTISSSDTWEKKELTFTGDTTGAFTNDTDESFSLLFWLGAGSDYTSGTLATSWASVSGAAANRAVGQVNHADSTSNNFYITGVQLEAGTAASDFEFLPADVNLNRCMRYFYKKVSTNPYGPLCQGMQIGGNDCMMQGYHPVKMRAGPSISVSGSWAVESGTTNAVFAIGTQRSNQFGWSNQQAISATDGSGAICYGNNDSSATFLASAEI